MTVCIAAICDNHSVFGATDRMLTGGDINFEPMVKPEQPGSKVVFLTTSIIALTAGDAGLQSEILQEVRARIGTRIREEEQASSSNVSVWWGVKEAAELYRTVYDEFLAARAGHRILAPLGLDSDSFISRQKEMADGFIRQITGDLVNFAMPAVATIFTGIDLTGPHIYVVDNHSVNCYDSIGFAAIGSGSRHSQTQFMLAGHDQRSSSAPETLFLTYLAKKRAEVAPGVGKGTDMITVGPILGNAILIGSHVVEKLEEIYNKHISRESAAFKASRKETSKYVEEITRASQAKQSQTHEIPGINDEPKRGE